jgi:hypothetical protein
MSELPDFIPWKDLEEIRKYDGPEGKEEENGWFCDPGWLIFGLKIWLPPEMKTK